MRYNLLILEGVHVGARKLLLVKINSSGDQLKEKDRKTKGLDFDFDAIWLVRGVRCLFFI